MACTLRLKSLADASGYDQFDSKQVRLESLTYFSGPFLIVVF